MKAFASLLALGALAMMTQTGCSSSGGGTAGGSDMSMPNVRVSGTTQKARFATAWSTKADPTAAAKEATQEAIKALNTPAKAIVFFTYYEMPGTKLGEDAPDLKKEEAVAKAVNSAAAGVPNIGCRGRSLTSGGTFQRDAISVLAIGGDQISCAATKSPIMDNRLSTGQQIASAMKGVKDLKIVIALAQPQLSFEAKEGVSVEDFIRGVIDNSPRGTILFGGNSMGGGPEDGAQFINGEPLTHSVVAVGIGGPIEVFSNHTNEFKWTSQEFTVTKAVEKWVIELDGKPAAQVYRQAYGMKPEDKLSWDDHHPMGVVVAPDKVYLRMVLNEVMANGMDKDGKPVQVKDANGMTVTIPPGSLRAVAPIVQGSKMKVGVWPGKAEPILASAGVGIEESMRDAKASGATPALSLLSDCCARGSRLLALGKGERDEVTQAINLDMKKAGVSVPVFGFYAYGELGPIRGTYQGLGVQYQQHTFVSTVIGIK